MKDYNFNAHLFIVAGASFIFTVVPIIVFLVLDLTFNYKSNMYYVLLLSVVAVRPGAEIGSRYHSKNYHVETVISDIVKYSVSFAMGIPYLFIAILWYIFVSG